MKKIFTISIIMVLVLGVLAGCTGKPEEEVGAVKLGLGIVTSIEKSRDMNGETAAQAQVDTTIAAVTFDKDGKILSVQIDVAQTRVLYDLELQVASDRTALQKTKKELGEAYNMKRVSGIDKEWYEQIAALEEWMIGKTIAEVKAMPLSETNVPTGEELTSSVTIIVESYITAVEAAWNNTIEVANVDKMGLGISIMIDRSRGLTTGETVTLPQAQVDTAIAATAFDKDGNVVGIIIDAAQTRVGYDADGKVTADKTAQIKTKKQLGAAYNMKPRSAIEKEWDEQIAAFEEWMVGQTVAQIKALPVTEGMVPTDEELTSSVTITVRPYLAAVEKSLATAR